MTSNHDLAPESDTVGSAEGSGLEIPIKWFNLRWSSSQSSGSGGDLGSTTNQNRPVPGRPSAASR